MSKMTLTMTIVFMPLYIKNLADFFCESLRILYERRLINLTEL